MAGVRKEFVHVAGDLETKTHAVLHLSKKCIEVRAGLSNGQTGQLPRALRFGGSRAF